MRTFEAQRRGAAVKHDAVRLDEAVLDEDGRIGTLRVDESVVDLERQIVDGVASENDGIVGRRWRSCAGEFLPSFVRAGLEERELWK